MKVFLDTHALVAVWERRIELFGKASRDLLESGVRLYSGVVPLELAILREVGKLAVAPNEILGDLARHWGITASPDALFDVAERSADFAWTRDPFDRLIVATAAIHDAPLVTRDEIISANYEKAVW